MSGNAGTEQVATPDFGHVVCSLIAAGAHLKDAREQVPCGWVAWLRGSVGISPSMARKLIAIAAHPVLANSAHANALPADLRALHILSHLDPPLLEAAIEAGRLRPGMDWRAVKRLVSKLQGHATAQRRERQGVQS
jgi:hypothetical protein